MKIVMVAENDPAGTAIQLKKAIEEYTSHQCRLITFQTRYNCNFEKDIHLEDEGIDLEWVYSLLEEADVLHFHMLVDENYPIGTRKLGDFVQGKTIIRHHHGHYNFRSNLEYYRDLYNKKDDLLLVSTPDMVKLFDKGRAIWLPNLLYVDSKYHYPKVRNNFLKISQSPTRKHVKATDILSKAVERVREEYNYPLSLDLIENETHQEVLRRKALSDVVFDQMNFSFGMSSLEAFALGKPVFCKLDEDQIDQILEFTEFKYQLPWFNVFSEEMLVDTIKQIIINPQILEEKSRIARYFIEAWNPQKILKIAGYLPLNH